MTGKKRTSSLARSADEAKPAAYASAFAEIRERIRKAQHAALKSVNKQLVGLYWDIGRIIVERQAAEGLGQGNCPTTGWRFAEGVSGRWRVLRIESLADEGIP